MTLIGSKRLVILTIWGSSVNLYPFKSSKKIGRKVKRKKKGRKVKRKKKKAMERESKEEKVWRKVG